MWKREGEGWKEERILIKGLQMSSEECFRLTAKVK
jgi:hypothetical protein